MGDNSKISWCDATWNCIYGCSKVSAGCQNCYAERHCHRFSAHGQRHEGLTKSGKNGPRWTGKVQLAPHRLDVPLRWKRARRIFANSLSDPFHPEVPFEFVAAMFGVAAACPQHTIMMLTKRPERMREFFEWMETHEEGKDGARLHACWCALAAEAEVHPKGDGGPLHTKRSADPDGPWPLPNVHLGVTVENQDALHRIDDLLECPAADYFLSIEPLLGPIELPDRCFGYGPPDPLDLRIGQIIIGGESGPGARPCDVGNIRSIIYQCREAGIKAFVKQLGAHVRWDGCAAPGQRWSTNLEAGASDDGNGRFRIHLHHPKAADMDEWPDDLRVQEFPEVR